MKATYNITNDKLLAWFDERLPKDTYERVRRCGFVFYPGRKCFAAKWSPTAEDLLKELGQTIEEDDTPDDLEARVERFANYAEKSEQRADSSRSYLETGANTERRQKNAISTIEKETEAAAYWNDRIAAAVRHAERRERPDVIGRRILGLEADRRRHVASYTPNPKVKPIMDSGSLCHWYGNAGRGGWWASESKAAAIKVEAERWVAHIDMRLAYEGACFEAAGGNPVQLRPERKKPEQPKGVQAIRNGGTPEALGAAGFRQGYGSDSPLTWRLITKVNRTTVEVMTKQMVHNSSQPRPTFYIRKVTIYSIDALKTRLEVTSDMPTLHDEWEELEAMRQRIAERRQAAQVAPTEVAK